jgi:hypothetical protein
MGNSAPTAAADGDDLAEFDGIETLGYRVLGVQPNSPGESVRHFIGPTIELEFTHYIYIPNTASKAGLVSFFDFIVGANGEMLMGSGEDLEEGEEYDDIDCKLPGFFCFLARAIGMLTALFSSSTSPRQPRKSCWIM